MGSALRRSARGFFWGSPAVSLASCSTSCASCPRLRFCRLRSRLGAGGALTLGAPPHQAARESFLCAWAARGMDAFAHALAHAPRPRPDRERSARLVARRRSQRGQRRAGIKDGAGEERGRQPRRQPTAHRQRMGAVRPMLARAAVRARPRRKLPRAGRELPSRRRRRPRLLPAEGRGPSGLGTAGCALARARRRGARRRGRNEEGRHCSGADEENWFDQHSDRARLEKKGRADRARKFIVVDRSGKSSRVR